MEKERLRPMGHSDSRLRVLRHLRRVGSGSRVELTEAVDLTKGTMTELIADLLRQGILVEERLQAAGRGRPRVMLGIDPDAAYALGFFPLRDGTATADIIDLQGNRVFSQSVAFRFGGLDELVPLLGDTVQAVMDRAPVAIDRLRAIGIVMPAHLDRERGVIHWMPPHNLHEPLPVADALQQRLGVPVSLENRATVLARGEHWFGEPGVADHFTMITLMEAGMGAACYVGGRLQGGVHGLNNEFGHVKVAFEGGRPCFCGGTGCLAAYATAPAIAAALAERQGQAPMEHSQHVPAFEAALARAEAGDGDALAVIERAGRALGMAMAGHVNAHDPGRVILASLHGAFLRLLEPVVRATVAAQLLPSLRGNTVLEFRPATLDGLLRGTAALALERLYALP
jgi:transcriptional regulator of PTS gene